MSFCLRVLLSAGAVFLVACAPNTSETRGVDNLRDDLGCKNFENLFFDEMDSFLVTEGRAPRLNPIRDRILKLARENVITKQEAEIWNEIYKILLEQAPEKENLKKIYDYRSLFAALEVGDETTAVRKELKARLKDQFLKMSMASSDCATEPAPPPTTPEDDAFEKRIINVNHPRSFLGMKWAFATAYQSCQAVRKPAMTSLSPSVEGIVVRGTNPINGGIERIIGDLGRILSTHYYYQGEAPTPQCFNFLQAPLIYDFGGKPNSAASVLDFFKNGGSGTEALGTDCSGMIYTAIATAGLRISPNKPLEARGVNGVSSSMFMRPDRNGLECFDYVSVNSAESIRRGDIAAVDGHVLMIGQTGPDPFGAKRPVLRADCNKITEEGFDFEIWQSSPEKQGIGINKYVASEYLKSGAMKSGFINYARQACLTRFDGTTINPRLSNFSIIRHNGSIACKTGRIVLAQESCIKDCPQIFE